MRNSELVSWSDFDLNTEINLYLEEIVLDYQEIQSKNYLKLSPDNKIQKPFPLIYP